MNGLRRVAIVTGAGTGIGKSAALALLREGYSYHGLCWGIPKINYLGSPLNFSFFLKDLVVTSVFLPQSSAIGMYPITVIASPLFDLLFFLTWIDVDLILEIMTFIEGGWSWLRKVSAFSFLSSVSGCF
jgi:hypothetical protein